MAFKRPCADKGETDNIGGPGGQWWGKQYGRLPEPESLKEFDINPADIERPIKLELNWSKSQESTGGMGDKRRKRFRSR